VPECAQGFNTSAGYRFQVNKLLENKTRKTNKQNNPEQQHPKNNKYIL